MNKLKIIYCCKDCGTKVHEKTALHGNRRCLSCAARERTKIPENNSNWKNGKSIIKYFCKDCNKEIAYVTAIFGTYRCKPCSLLLQKGKNHPNYIDGRKSKKRFCQKCNKQLKSYTAKKCSSCIKIGKNCGKYNVNYIPNLERKYPLKFTKELKLKIRTRDNFTCQNPECNITEKEHMNKFKCVLHVHHIDYNKENCAKNNLITTCLNCNTSANHNRDYWFAYYTYLIKNFN